MSAISSAKDELIAPDELLLNAAGDYAKTRVAQVYKEYQKVLAGNNALDFDDLIMKTVELFGAQPDVLEYYQNRFKYIMVDEYQDTNTAQFKFVSLLASKYKNLCVVGDDDQSIYKFRGANIYNILNFEKEYPDAKVIKLEQNYRSTKNILEAANSVIRNNSGRKSKTLWTSNEVGEPIDFEQFNTEYEEAAGIVDSIEQRVRDGAKYSECAVLYRTNAQSRVLEEKFVIKGIPYKIIGGQNFYARKEIKDLLCYLKTIDNGHDDLAVRRIINIPKRGIGVASLNKVSDYAQSKGLSLFEAMTCAYEIPGLGRAAQKIVGFTTMIQVFRTKLAYVSLAQLMQEILDETGYVKELETDGSEEALGRIENIDELVNKIIAFEEDNDEASLSEFLEEVSLVADIDNLESSNEKVVLMTLHSAKGLEFPYVYLAGMEDGLFPSYMTIVSDDALEVEEERRLAYVGITRAMKHLTLTYAKSRMVRGVTQYNKVSRFVKEIPSRLISMRGVFEKKNRWNGLSASSSLKPYGESFVGNAGENAVPSGRSKLDELLKNQKIFKGSDLFEKKTAPVLEALDYAQGDRVVHMKFGEGTVVKIEDNGKGDEVTVNFDKAGIKKMMAAFAKLKPL